MVVGIGRERRPAGRAGALLGRSDSSDRTDAELRSPGRAGRPAPTSRIASLHSHSLDLGANATRARHARDRARVQRTVPHGTPRARRAGWRPNRSRAPRATIPAMTTRRDHRQTHVRPRPPSTGRPAPVKVKPRAPGPTRLSGHRPIQRTRGLPLDRPGRAGRGRGGPRDRGPVRRARRPAASSSPGSARRSAAS